MASPLLPWEVIERVAGHSGDDSWTLRSFSLTCRDLHPRALCLLVADVCFYDRDKIFDFCDFLQAHPHLKPLVCSVTVEPGDFAPFPLLSILPNLSNLKFYPVKYIQPEDQRAITNVLNRSTVAYCKPLGMNIQALHISELSFPTFLDFARLLLTFTNLKDLSCLSVVIKAEANQAHVDVIKQRMSDRLHLSTLEMDLSKDFTPLSVVPLFFDVLAVRSTVETLTGTTIHSPYARLDSGFLHSTTSWPRLRTLVMKLEFDTQDVHGVIAALKDFPLSTLKDVTVDLFHSEFNKDEDVNSILLSANTSLWLEFEQTMLRFSRPKVTIHLSPGEHLRVGRSSFWTEEIGKDYFPGLFQQGAFKVTSSTAVLSGAGHDSSVRDFVTSPDGKWVATGSGDSTIILWDAADGTVVQEWVAHSYEQVTSLAFSPDSRFLVSGGGDSNLKIWDVAQGSRGVTTLKGHTDSVTSCAWSPHGDTIASGSYDETVRLWDSHTFRTLHVLEPEWHSDAELRPDSIARLVAFSPDGSWLVSGTRHSYNIWNVASGTLHKSLHAEEEYYYPTATFSPRSTHLLVAGDHEVKLVSVEARVERVVWRGAESTRDVAFSPDGTLFVTASDDGMVKLWNADTSTEKFTLEGHTQAVTRACFSPCGEYVASASGDHTVRLWRTKNGSCMTTLYDHNCWVWFVAFSPDGKSFWSGDVAGTVMMRRMRDIVPSSKQASENLCSMMSGLSVSPRRRLTV